jgi:hypothetical protein
MTRKRAAPVLKSETAVKWARASTLDESEQHGPGGMDDMLQFNIESRGHGRGGLEEAAGARRHRGRWTLGQARARTSG